MGSGSVLVVDDDARVRDLVARYLANQGYQITQAANAEETLPYLGQRAIDLLITDFQMPGMDGLELARKALSDDPDRPVILMTAHADVENARQSVRIGVYDFILKPFEIADFGNAVARALNHRRLVKENRAYQANLEIMVEERTRELNRKVKELEARDRINQHLLTVHSPDETLSTILDAVQGALDVERVVVFLPGAPGQELAPAVGAGIARVGDQASSETMRERPFPWLDEAGAAATLAFREGRAVWGEGASPGTSAAVPMLRLGEVVGVVFVQNAFSGRPIPDEDVQTLASLMPQAAVAISDAMLYSDSQRLKDIEQELATFSRSIAKTS